MNIHARKLSLIEGLLRVKDADLLFRVETYLKTEITKSHEKEIVPMSMKAYFDMIDHSLEDVQSGRIITHEELKKEIEQWAEK